MNPPRLGGCDFLEDPALDARTAQPVWLPDPDPLVTIVPALVDEAAPFSLWKLPGRKSLLHDGGRLLLHADLGREAVRAVLSLSLTEGDPSAYAAPAGARGQRTLAAAATLNQVFTGEASSRSRSVTRGDVVHMRALQALDAERDGASEREIAGLVFGAIDPSESWNDSAQRASVRYLLGQGRTLRDGGYRNLLYPKPQKRRAADP